MQRIFVGNLPWDTSEEELRGVLEPYKPTTVNMPRDRETGKFRGFTFVDVEDAQQAIRDLDGGDFGGRTIKVKIAEERQPRSGGGDPRGSRREFSRAAGDRGGYDHR